MSKSSSGKRLEYLSILFVATLLEKNVLSDSYLYHDSKGERAYYGRKTVIR
jgi:hypothetical protein